MRVEIEGTTPYKLIEAITAAVVAELRPMIEASTEPMLVDGDRMAELVGISRPNLDRLRAAGIVPSVSVGRRRLYRPDAVVAALETQAAGGADHV